MWMSIAALPEFRKLWGTIDGLSVGKYRFSITSYYDVSDFSGHKYVILTTSSALGGKSSFLGIIACVIGATSIVGSAVFFFAHYIEMKRSR